MQVRAKARLQIMRMTYKELYEFNAKALVTTWGSEKSGGKGGLKDYSNIIKGQGLIGVISIKQDGSAGSQQGQETSFRNGLRE